MTPGVNALDGFGIELVELFEEGMDEQGDIFSAFVQLRDRDGKNVEAV